MFQLEQEHEKQTEINWFTERKKVLEPEGLKTFFIKTRGYHFTEKHCEHKEYKILKDLILLLLWMRVDALSVATENITILFEGKCSPVVPYLVYLTSFQSNHQSGPTLMWQYENKK